MSTGGALVIVMALLFGTAGWLAAAYSMRQVAEHRRLIAERDRTD